MVEPCHDYRLAKTPEEKEKNHHVDPLRTLTFGESGSPSPERLGLMTTVKVYEAQERMKTLKVTKAPESPRNQLFKLVSTLDDKQKKCAIHRMERLLKEGEKIKDCCDLIRRQINEEYEMKKMPRRLF